MAKWALNVNVYSMFWQPPRAEELRADACKIPDAALAVTGQADGGGGIEIDVSNNDLEAVVAAHLHDRRIVLLQAGP